MSMDKDAFWQVIDAVNGRVAKNDLDGILQATKEELGEFSQTDIAVWVNHQYYYKDLADTSGLFAAACCLNNFMSDDGFTDFRMWLISQGKDVYLAALKNPDSLAALDTPVDTTRFEPYGYVGMDAYDQWDMHGDVYEDRAENPLTRAQKTDIRAEIEYFPHDVAGESAAAHLPDMCAKYLAPGAPLKFRYTPLFDVRANGPENTSMLEKMKQAALLVESMTDSRFVDGIAGAYIHPGRESNLAVNMYKELDLNARLTRITFDANIRKMGGSMNAAGLMRLQQEVGVTHALLLALETETYHLTPDELKQFDDFVRELDAGRLEQQQADGPGLEQTM